MHGCNIQEKTIEAVRLIKDYHIQCGGLENITTNKQLTQMCSFAYLKYEAEQDFKIAIKADLEPVTLFKCLLLP